MYALVAPDDSFEAAVVASASRAPCSACSSAPRSRSRALSSGLTRNPLATRACSVNAGARCRSPATALLGAGVVARCGRRSRRGARGRRRLRGGLWSRGRDARAAHPRRRWSPRPRRARQGLSLALPEVFDSLRFWSTARSPAAVRRSVRSAGSCSLACSCASRWPALNAVGSVTGRDPLGVSRRTKVPLRRGRLCCARLPSRQRSYRFRGLATPRRAVLHGRRPPLAAAPLRGLGPVLVIGSDVIGRVVARPGELMVGAVTAFVGAPFLIAAVRRGRVGL